MKKLKLFLKIYIFINIFIEIISHQQDIQDVNEQCQNTNITSYLNNNKFNTIDEFFDSINIEPETDEIDENSIKTLYMSLIGENLNYEENEYKAEFSYIYKNYFLNYYAFIILILWFISIILVIIKLRIFKSLKIRHASLSQILITGVILFLIICLISIFSYSKSKQLQISINNVTCFLLRFFYRLNYGKIKNNNKIETITPTTNVLKDKWPGFFNLGSFLVDTADTITQIANQTDESFNLLNELMKSVDEYDKLIIKITDTVTNNYIENPNYKIKGNITPIYLYEFINVNKNKTLLGSIYNEFEDIKKNIDYIINLKIEAEILKENEEFHTENFYDIFDNISNYFDFIKDKSVNITDNMMIIQKISQTLIYFINYKCITNLSISLLIIIFILIYWFLHFEVFKIVLHVVWNVVYASTISVVCFCYFLFNLSDNIKNSIYLMDNEVLQTNNNPFFYTCLNEKDSDLNNFLFSDEENLSVYELEKNYKLITPLFENEDDFLFKNSDLIDMSINEIDKYYNNLYLSTNESYEKSDINYILDELSDITTSQSCKTNDIWVSNKKFCRDYFYINKNDINLITNRYKEKYCFSIEDIYESKDITYLYQDYCTDETFIKINETIFYITKYYKTNLKILSSIKQILNQLNEKNKNLAILINDQLEQCKLLYENLYETFKSIIGHKEIKFIFMCRGIKNELIIYYDIIYNYVFYYLKLLGFNFLLIVFLNLFGITCIIISVVEYKKSFRTYLKLNNKDINGDGVELIEEVPGEYKEENDEK